MMVNPKKYEVGIIGAGDMGMLYAKRFKQLGKVVEEYGRATKVGAIVAGQTSVKTPEIEAFAQYLPADVHIVTCHSMHGPNIDTKGQPLAIIRKYREAVEVLGALESRMIYLTYEEHDRITADTQAATHLSFISLGTAWSLQGYHPWLNPQFISGINNVKQMAVYAGLAIMNPLAKKQLQCYVESMTDLYKHMVAGKKQEFRELVHQAADFIFGKDRRNKKILLEDDILDQLSLSQVPKEMSRPNSHLSLLSAASADPPFRMWLGIVEYLFCNEEMLEESIETALEDRYTQAEDWCSTRQSPDGDSYRARFEKTAAFLSHKLEEGKDLSTMILKKLTDKEEQEQQEQQQGSSRSSKFKSKTPNNNYNSL
ncbi:hypothetical protein BX661DRAFT_193921 [Kickxella alabastrina]|uniref:uncharacterized protein n=1 Tax=Kickxella alabastrina TaxID=61397 RepID=UPI00221E6201|nr:uncharacterized protein BX661DRAFT_193921 [Kickxella alabastrina]KAI7827282.1 hypothetical protein BX661DRAFT_193921 [Kickxella alabastrina]